MYYSKLTDLGIKLTRHSGQEKTKCPQCSDGRKNKADRPLSVNISQGTYHCHNCGWKGNCRSFERKREIKTFDKPSREYLKQIEIKDKTAKWFLEKRGISQSTLDKFLIFNKEEYMPQTGNKENCICFPYFREDELLNIKFRDANKNFRMVSGAELVFYNLNSLKDKKKCIVVEGEIDCLSAYEAGIGQDLEPFSEYGIVSVPNGASGGNQKMDYLDNCSDWFVGMEEIIIATDGDEAGISLRNELIRRLGAEICRFVVYPTESMVDGKDGLKRAVKDFNEVLMTYGKNGVLDLVKAAHSVPVDGIYFVEDIFGSMLDNFNKGIQLAPTTRFKQLDEYFRWKKGDINLITGYANAGKTFFILQLMLTKSIYDGWKWAVFSPENYPANDFYDDLVEMYAGKWLRNMTQEEYVVACEFINDHIFYIYPEDDHDIVLIHEKFRYLVLKKGIDGVLIDPWNQLDHNQGSYQREDQYLSEQLKNVKRFALLNAISYNIVAHPKTPRYEENRSLPVADIYDISGGSMWGNKADQILSYHRPRFHEDKNSPEVEVHLQKVKRKRTGGSLGHVNIKLLWSKKRYVEEGSEIEVCSPARSEELKKAQKLDAEDDPNPKSNYWWDKDKNNFSEL